MLKSYKYRIYPTKSQITKIENTFSICRALYNNALEHRLTEFKRTGRAINYYEQANSLPEIKSMFPWYKSVYSTVLQDVLKRLEKSYQSFFRRMKDSKIKSSEKGYPKFKKKGQWNSITYANGKDIKYPEAVAEYFEPEPIGKYSELKAKSCRSMAIEGCRNNVVSVPKIGDIKIVLHRNIPANGMIKTMSIIKEANKWFVTFSVELNNSYPEPEPKAKNLGEYYELNVNELKSIGIDVGLIDFYYDSNGVNKKAPRLLRLSEKNLKRLQRKLSTCIKRSKEYYKVLKALQKAFFRIKTKRLDFLYQTAYELFKSNDLVVREDLQLKNLIKRPKPKLEDDIGNSTGRFLPNNACAKSGLNKSFNDASFGRFFDILEQVASKLGKLVIKVAPNFTSQDCSNCGNRVKKSLSTRTHNCKECGLVLNRDLNASLNIKRLGLQSLGIKSLETNVL